MAEDEADPPEEGDRVEVRVQRLDGESWVAAMVLRIRKDGAYKVQFDDGSQGRYSREDMRRFQGMVSPSRTGRSGGRRLEFTGRGGLPGWEVGMEVQARFPNTTTFHNAEIQRIKSDGQIVVRYLRSDLPKRELSLGSEDLKPVESLEDSKDAASERGRGDREVEGGVGQEERLREGTRVEAFYRGKKRFYPGTITRAHKDGTYDIHYDNGVEEHGLDRALVRLIPEKEDHEEELMARPELEGREEARRDHEDWGGEEGRAVRPRYDPRASRVERQDSVAGDTSPSSGAVLEAGMEVEARFQGKGRFYPGRIRRANSDGTFNVHYKDGQKEPSVPARLIRPLDGSVEISRAMDAVRQDDEREETYPDRQYPTQSKEKAEPRSTGAVAGTPRMQPMPEFMLDMRVEARFRGKASFFPGRISRVNSDGTFDILYDDKDEERDVPAGFIRATPEREPELDSDPISARLPDQDPADEERADVESSSSSPSKGFGAEDTAAGASLVGTGGKLVAPAESNQERGVAGKGSRVPVPPLGGMTKRTIVGKSTTGPLRRRRPPRFLGSLESGGRLHVRCVSVEGIDHQTFAIGKKDYHVFVRASILVPSSVITKGDDTDGETDADAQQDWQAQPAQPAVEEKDETAAAGAKAAAAGTAGTLGDLVSPGTTTTAGGAPHPPDQVVTVSTDGAIFVLEGKNFTWSDPALASIPLQVDDTAADAFTESEKEIAAGASKSTTPPRNLQSTKMDLKGAAGPQEETIARPPQLLLEVFHCDKNKGAGKKLKLKGRATLDITR